MKRSRHGNCWNVCLRDMRDLASGSDCRNRDSVGSNSRHKNNPMGVRASGDGAPRRRGAVAAITERGRSGSASNRNLEWGGPEESTHSLSLRGGKRTTGKKHGPWLASTSRHTPHLRPVFSVVLLLISCPARLRSNTAM